MMKKLELTYHDEWIELKATKELSIKIRRMISPSSLRQYHANTNTWSVHNSKIQLLIKLAKKSYEIVDYSQLPLRWQMAAAGATPIENIFEPDYHKILYLLKDAPMEVVKASYKALAALYHPDKGTGDVTMFHKVREAYEKIKQKL